MSSIDLTNSQVLKNYILGQMRESKGEFHIKEKVLVFREKNGAEFVVPEELEKEFQVVKEATGEILIDGPSSPIVLETGEVQIKKKKKLLVK